MRRGINGIGGRKKTSFLAKIFPTKKENYGFFSQNEKTEKLLFLSNGFTFATVMS